jgi:superfamily II DNA or RNA helicase
VSVVIIPATYLLVGSGDYFLKGMSMINVVLTDSSVLVTPVVSGLAAQLECKRREQTTEQGKLKYSYDIQPLSIVQNGTLITYPGLSDRVLTYLKDRKLEYKVEDCRSGLPEVDIDRVADCLRETQPEILATIFSSRRGVIVSPPGSGKTFGIEQICKAYPKEKILVITRRQSVLDSIYKRIKAVCTDSLTCIVKALNPPVLNSSIIVCSAKSLHKIPTEWPTLLLFDEVHGSAAGAVSEQLTRFSGCRMFGFTASPTGRSDKAELLIEALFGKEICNVSYEYAKGKGIVVPIRVNMYKVSCAEIVKKFPVAKDRHNIWRNATRNSKIASLAKLYDKEEQVLILVRTVEHALYLRRFLPEYTVVHAGIAKDKLLEFRNDGLIGANEDLSVDKDKARDDFRSGVLRKVIVTDCWSEGVDFPELRVLIRADAGAGLIPAIQIGGRLSRVVEDKAYGLLIDFMDDFGKGFLGRSKHRIKHYKSQDWRIDYMN